jgi:histidinol dehydrogenase
MSNLRKIEGFDAARKALSRLTPVESYPISAALRSKLVESFGTDDPEQAVKIIINEVRRRRDAAIFDLTAKIDGIKLIALEVPRDELSKARKEVGDELISALKLAAERINAFHTSQRDSIWQELNNGDVAQLLRPLERVGIYVPGGTASYPSTVLMTVVPARVAGVKEVILVTPPGKDGAVPPATLAAADIAGVDRVFCIGGAQAVAALAYGTESVPRVDKVCGPGNIFVVLAKKLVYGAVAIDGLQGPSEVMIIADDTANPEYCAADLLAQAEHDPLASAILVTTSRVLVEEIDRELKKQITGLSRQSVIDESLNRGVIAIVDSLDKAMELANLYAPEHLSLMVKDADTLLKKVTSAGCVLIGDAATVVLGDYIAGPSHVLPTGGTARFSSPLNITDFIKFINTIAIDEAGMEKLGRAAALLARAEGLDAHARAMEKRLEQD